MQPALTLETYGSREDCPVFPIFVESEKVADCWQPEVSALSQSSLKLCVGCLGLQNTALNYISAKPDSTCCYQPRPLRGKFFDLCSCPLYCQDPLQCISGIA